MSGGEDDCGEGFSIDLISELIRHSELQNCLVLDLVCNVESKHATEHDYHVKLSLKGPWVMGKHSFRCSVLARAAVKGQRQTGMSVATFQSARLVRLSREVIIQRISSQLKSSQ